MAGFGGAISGSDGRRAPESCYLETVKFAGQELPSDGFDRLTPGVPEIVLSRKAATIAGTVLDDQEKALPDTTLTLISSGRKPRPQKVTADDAGAFKFTGLRPGSYQVFAWEEIDGDVWQDPGFLKNYEARALQITAGPGATQTLQPHVIAAADIK